MITYEDFHIPNKEYTTVPFWFWNHRMEKGEITRQLELMVREHVYECVIHARHGLLTPYLSEEWFDCVGHALQEGKRLGMRFWLYDENNWPSGYAGGRVLGVNPDFCAKHIKMLQTAAGEEPDLSRAVQVAAVFAQREDGGWFRHDNASKELPRRTFAVYDTRWKVAYGEDYYVDLLNPQATKTFLHVTHEAYLERFGEDMGTVVRGFFSDEAGFYNGLQLPWSDREDDGTLVWTADFPQYFEEQCGYDVLDILPALFLWDDERSPKARRDFQQTACALYRQSFLRPQREFCEAHGMQLIGHLHYEDYLHLHVATQGDFIKAISEFSYAGLDRIEYWPGAVSERLTASVARQYDKPRVLSETFARSGWDCTMQEMRRWTDFQLVRGVNLFVIHAFFYNTEGFRREDAPPSFFFQSPAYPFYHIYSDYVMRMCRLLTEGAPVNRLGVYFPTAAGQVLFDVWDRESVRSLDRDVQEVVRALEESQYDCCMLHEDALAHAVYRDGGFAVGRETIAALAVVTRWLPCCVLESIARMARQGLPVAFLRHRPRCIEWEHRQRFDALLTELCELPNVAYINEYAFYRQFTYSFEPKCLGRVEGFLEAARPLVTLRTADPGLKCCGRKSEGKTVYFLVNETGATAENLVSFPERGVPVIWDAVNGTREPCDFTVEKEGVALPVRLPPYTSLVVAFGDEAAPTRPKEKLLTRKVLDGEWSVTAGNARFRSQAVCLEAKGLGGAEKITYEYEVALADAGDAALLEIHHVHNVCQVSVNGNQEGVILWQPNRLRCASFVKGRNRIAVTVYVTPAGVMGEPCLPFGIEGPVTLDILKYVEELR